MALYKSFKFLDENDDNMQECKQELT